MANEQLLYARLARSIGSRSRMLNYSDDDDDDPDYDKGASNNSDTEVSEAGSSETEVSDAEYKTGKRKTWPQRRNVKRRPRYKDADKSPPQVREREERVEISLLLRRNKFDIRYTPLPIELLERVIKTSVDSHYNPLTQLVNCASVCETWRQIVINTANMWSRLRLNHVPATKNNILTLIQLIESNPMIARHIEELEFESWRFDNNTMPLLMKLMREKTVKRMKFVNISTCTTFYDIMLANCKALTSLSVIRSKTLLESSSMAIKWREIIEQNASTLDTLDLSESFRCLKPKLIEDICACSQLKYLDLSCYEFINNGNQGVDAALIAQSLPRLEVFRGAGVSFKRTAQPENYQLLNLRHLSIPIAILDVERDDALYSVLAYGSLYLEHIDIRGSYISDYALCSTPSPRVVSIHLDNNSHLARNYPNIIRKWAPQLEHVSLIRIGNVRVIDECLLVIAQEQSKNPKLMSIDLTYSDVTMDGLKPLLISCASTLTNVNLTSCRALPRGFKDNYIGAESLTRLFEMSEPSLSRSHRARNYRKL